MRQGVQNDEPGASLSTPPRVIVLDVETAPNLGFTWGYYEQNVIEVVREWFMLSFSYKMLHEKRVFTYALPDFPETFKKSIHDDGALLALLRDVLDESDIVIGHNVDRFDLKKANSRMFKANLIPPSPYQTVDTLKVAKSTFKQNSNRLGDLADFLGLPGKMKHQGFKLWKDCMDGDLVAFRKLKQYNAQDVRVTEEVYLAMLPWMKRHPNVAAMARAEGVCPACGSSRVIRRGWNYAIASRSPRFQCQDCFHWGKGGPERLPEKILR